MLELDIQNPADFDSLPKAEDLHHWLSAAIEKKDQANSVTLRFVDEAESQQLNHTYRDKDKPTNVLSFPFEAPDFMAEIPELEDASNHLGDLVFCEPVVLKEAIEQGKTAQQHWAHLVVHGTLHLQGYDHLNDDEANQMESLEIKILNELGFENPYLTH